MQCRLQGLHEGALTQSKIAMSPPSGRSEALISWILPRVLSRRRHATEHPAVHQSLSRHPQLEENSRLKGSCFAAGDVYRASESPVRRIIASRLVLWLLLRTQAPFVSIHD